MLSACYAQMLTVRAAYPAQIAYLGPGGGFAVTISLLTTVLVAAGVILVIVVSPLSFLWWSLLRGRRPRKRRFRRVVVLGLDGLDPKVLTHLMGRGRLPNFRRLAEGGCFHRSRTTMPAVSPTAWSSFATGTDASHHGIYGFVTRDAGDYSPKLSSYEITPRGGRSTVRLLRKGKPFWHTLGEAGVETAVLRAPITFPPERFRGRLLSGMCVPDLRGTQGVYTVYGTRDPRKHSTGGDFIQLTFKRGAARTEITGPSHPADPSRGHLTIPMVVRVLNDGAAEVRFQGDKVELSKGRHSRWLRLCFRAGRVRVRGLVSFYLRSVRPEVVLYMTAVHIDPEAPRMQIGHPGYFCDYLAKATGPYGTLGLLEDTAALNDGALDENGFMQQVWRSYHERKRMLFRVLEDGGNEVTIAVFDTPDRVQHMFWRPNGRASAGEGEGRYHPFVERTYAEMDRLVGEVAGRVPAGSLLLVLSDHGFAGFRWSVNLNTWLYRHGYLALKPRSDGRTDWFGDVDWSRTRAYALGLTGIFINLKGREGCGTISPGEEFRRLAATLKSQLEGLRLPRTGSEEKTDPRGAKRPIRRVVIVEEAFEGPLRSAGPDLVVCFQDGYRCCWEGAKGRIAEQVVSENTRPWRGDHCVDPELVPGVLLSNRPLTCRSPGIEDVGPTVLDAFGLEPGATVQGRSLLRAAGDVPVGDGGQGTQSR